MTAGMNSTSRILDGLANGAAGFGYEAPAAVHDEMLHADGSPRLPWQTFLRGLQSLGMGELTRRWEEAKHLIRENGVTYNVYGDPRGMARPWQLDPVPLLIPF